MNARSPCERCVLDRVGETLLERKLRRTVTGRRVEVGSYVKVRREDGVWLPTQPFKEAHAWLYRNDNAQPPWWMKDDPAGAEVFMQRRASHRRAQARKLKKAWPAKVFISLEDLETLGDRYCNDPAYMDVAQDSALKRAKLHGPDEINAFVADARKKLKEEA
jgi:hypothetical protein